MTLVSSPSSSSSSVHSPDGSNCEYSDEKEKKLPRTQYSRSRSPSSTEKDLVTSSAKDSSQLWEDRRSKDSGVSKKYTSRRSSSVSSREEVRRKRSHSKSEEKAVSKECDKTKSKQDSSSNKSSVRESSKEDKKSRRVRSRSRERLRPHDRSPYRRDTRTKRRSRSRDRYRSSPRRRSHSRGRKDSDWRRSRSRSYERRHYRRRRSISRGRYRRYRRSHSRSRSRNRTASDRSKGRGVPAINKVGSLPLTTTAGAVTPQMALQQTMAAMNAKAQALTGIELPKYYNPAAVNPLKYAEQVQKRKLLWQSKDKEKEAEAPKGSVWDKLKFAQDQDGKMTAKFRKLMGIKGEDEGGSDQEGPVPEDTEAAALQKQEVLFRDLDQQYEMARMSTHTHRGVGLGYSSQAIFPPMQKP